MYLLSTLINAFIDLFFVLRKFKSKVQNEIHKASIAKRKAMEPISKYSSPTGQPLMLGELDSLMQSYIKPLRNRGGVVNTDCKCDSKGADEKIS